MRKFTLTLVSLLVTASLLLAGCGSSTPEPAPVETNEASSGQEAEAAPAEESLSGTISISGAFALYPMMTVWADEFTNIHPDVQFDIQGGGAGKGMTDTIAGAVDIGMISRAIKDEETAQGVFWVSVTKDAVFPIISSENPVAAQMGKVWRRQGPGRPQGCRRQWRALDPGYSDQRSTGNWIRQFEQHLRSIKRQHGSGHYHSAH